MKANTTYIRKYTKQGAKASVMAIPTEDGQVELTMQKWAPSGRRLAFRQSKWTLRAATTLFSAECSDLEKLGWVREQDKS